MKKNIITKIVAIATTFALTFASCEKSELSQTSAGTSIASKTTIPYTIQYSNIDTVFHINGVLGSNHYYTFQSGFSCGEWALNDYNSLNLIQISPTTAIWEYAPLISAPFTLTITDLNIINDTIFCNFRINNTILNQFKIYGEQGFVSDLVRYNEMNSSSNTSSDSLTSFTSFQAQPDSINLRSVTFQQLFTPDMRLLLGVITMDKIKNEINTYGTPLNDNVIDCYAKAKTHKKNHSGVGHVENHLPSHIGCTIDCTSGAHLYYPF